MSKNDEKIKILMAKVEKQKEDLGPKPKISYKTNGIFKYKNGEFFNLNTVTNPDVLVMSLGEILKELESYERAAIRLNVKTELKWDGHCIEDWEEDFKQRLSIIMYNERQKLLKQSQEKLKSLVSEETRTEMELEDIEKLLG